MLEKRLIFSCCILFLEISGVRAPTADSYHRLTNDSNLSLPKHSWKSIPDPLQVPKNHFFPINFQLSMDSFSIKINFGPLDCVCVCVGASFFVVCSSKNVIDETTIQATKATITNSIMTRHIN